MARPTPRSTAAETPEKAAGSVMEVIDCQSVAPRASDPSFITLGTLVSASSATETTVGNAISPTTMPTNRYVDPPLSANAPPAHGLITVKPMKP